MTNLLDSQNSSILVVRPDRLGDVILSTPVFELIKKHYPRSQVTALVKEAVLPVLKDLKSIDDFILFEPEGKHSGFFGFLKLSKEIRKKKFRIAVVLQSHWKIAAAVFFAGIQHRIGPLSKLHSFLFYNRGVRQHRSQVEMHEADYNLQLLRKLGIRVATRQIPTRVGISEKVLKEGKDWLQKQGWNSKQPLVLIHPGMGGSALNWPETHYVDLIRACLAASYQVLVTGGPLEGELLDRVEQALGSRSCFFYRGEKGSTVDFLGSLCTYAQVVVAPSTGPLHLAVALEKRVVTFYPPIRVQSALRWGPYLEDESRATVLVPEFYCGQDYKCIGNLCNYFPCMKSLTVKQAMEEVTRHISQQKDLG